MKEITWVVGIFFQQIFVYLIFEIDSVYQFLIISITDEVALKLDIVDRSKI